MFAPREALHELVSGVLSQYISLRLRSRFRLMRNHMLYLGVKKNQL
jgi:hypothetical protein